MNGASKKNQPSTQKKRPASAPPARDWLADHAAKAGLAEAALESVRAWLSEQFVADEFAKLGQGGHAETRVPLRRVFVDLSVSHQPTPTPETSLRKPFLGKALPSTPQSLSALCAVGPGRDLDEADSPRQWPRPKSTRNLPRGGPPRPGILLIGGPGQGKSTLGQLACQLHRAALLRAHAAGLSTSVQDVLVPFEDADGKKEGLALPPVPLLPLRVVLPDAAAWFAKSENQEGEELALLRFLAAQPSARKAKLQARTLQALAAHMPFFLLLDGFDEVGAAEDRARIVNVTRDFLLRLADQGAQAIVLATTRPQGYAGELSGVGIPLVEQYLVPLDRDEALAYAKKLIEAKISGADEQAKTLARLHEALAEEATARLLKSPLQVTIMAALVQQGRAPSERWKLFSSYFDFTYRREIERESYASKLLAMRRSHIEEIHRRVALVLQVEGEQAGAGARISRNDLRDLVDEVLKEDEIKDDERSDLVVRIVDAAEKRLVFLVEPEPGLFGFEIRSLQEFMAAWALTEGRESTVEARLLQIAKAPLFRHVVLFMSSRFFSERSGLRDVLAERICVALDEDPADALARATKMGALLALEVLEEGSVAGQPKRERALMERACELLDLPLDDKHARLVAVANSDTEKSLRNALELRLNRANANPHADELTTWYCLNLAATENHAWAESLAHTYGEALVDPGRLLVACNDHFTALSPWLVSRIEAVPESFSPPEVLRTELFLRAAARIGLVHRLHGSFFLPWRDSGIRLAWARNFEIAPIRVTTEPSWETFFLEMRSASPTWRIWFAAAAFQCAPSAAALEKTLRLIAANWESNDPEQRALAYFVSWPLAACLNGAASAAELLHFADLAATGELGDATQWLTAQKEWAERSSFHAVLDALVEGRPWAKEALEKAPPLTVFDFFRDRGFVRDDSSAARALLAHAEDRFRKTRSSKLREYLARICLQLAVQDKTQDYMRMWMEAVSPEYLGRPAHVSASEWSRVVDVYGVDLLPHAFVNPEIAAQRYLQEPQNSALLSMLMKTFERYTQMRAPQIPELEPELERRIEDALATHTYSTARARADAVLVRLWLGLSISVDNAFDVIALAEKDNTSVWYALLSALEYGQLAETECERLLMRIVQATFMPWEVRAQAIGLMRHVAANTRRSGLADPTTWTRLELPAPYPKGPALVPGGVVLPERPISISELQIQHVRGIHKLELTFTPAAPDQGQWIVFLGPNGAGKTTILRSLILALRNLQNPKIWPKGAFDPPWRQFGGPAQATIQVKLAHQGMHTTRIRANGSESFVQDPPQVAPRLVPLFAYGCRRGSALGGADRAVELTDDDGPEVATLFHEGASLIHAETWLMRWDGDAQRNPRSKIIYDAVRAALQKILDVESIEVADQNVWVREKDKPRLLFKALSDGYISTAGWVIDLIARWIVLAERSKVNIDKDFCQRMTGLVLVDEIDLFLHPRWQVDVIERTRKLFPKMSFVVTTHNPLTLVGAKPDEIWMLSMDGGRIQAARGQETPMLLTGGQIYSQYFGIRDLYPHELGRKLRRYGFLSGYAMRNDAEQAEMEALREELRARGIDPGWEEVPREMPSSRSPMTRYANWSRIPS